ncbi:hypothetical protein P879_07290 [Paragonimus westermani]|uniref:Uncharacterized protein n=1 Tax=Paragonimus westermani TaxID=34504 RepID=A0A8T0DCJ6_9TREM|nr:hypothetical protein P879_07290 [Paragonimus westermani]
MPTQAGRTHELKIHSISIKSRAKGLERTEKSVELQGARPNSECHNLTDDGFKKKDFVKVHGVVEPVILGTTAKHGIKVKTFSQFQGKKPNKEKRLAEIEDKLLKHPLILFPYLQKSVSPTKFKEAFVMVDPRMNLPLLQEDDEDRNDATNRSNLVSTTSVKTRSSTTKLRPLAKYSNPDALDMLAHRKSYGKVLDPEIFIEYPELKEKTDQLCQWIADLDGKQQDIPESTTIASLFTGIHEAQPAISAPITVVNTDMLPHNLHRQVSRPPTNLMEKRALEDSQVQSRRTKSALALKMEKQFEKLRYGAWFLPPRAWKVLRANQSLCESTQGADSYEAALRRRTEELNTKIVEMHGFEAFMEYIRKKKKRTPEVMCRLKIVSHCS